MSNLVRQAVRERYLGDREQRRAAMQQFVGIRKFHPASADSIEEVTAFRTPELFAFFGLPAHLPA